VQSQVQIELAGGGHATGLSLSQAASSAHAARSRELLRWLVGHHGHHRQPGEHAGGANASNFSVQSEKHNVHVIEEFQSAACPGSTYFIDWGSTGWKVYRAHPLRKDGKAEPTEFADGTLEVLKLSGVTAEASNSTIQWMLGELLRRAGGSKGTGTSGPEGGAILATGGFRLVPDKAKALWQAVRDWSNTETSLFDQCGGDSNNSDCHTVTGSEEAHLEMLSMVRSVAGKEMLRGDEKIGFASAGGASIQVGVQGAESDIWQCHMDLGDLSTDLDPRRTDITKIDGVDTLFVSFLAVFDLDSRIRTCEGNDGARVCDYEVGGLDHMRARFDEFLVREGEGGTNPCLSPATSLKADDGCLFFHAETCVLDRFHSKISRLPPAPDEDGNHTDRRARCGGAVARFLQKDMLLSKWRSSPSCMSLAGNVSKWGFLSSFSRDNQIGAHVSGHWLPFAEVERAAHGVDFASADDVQHGLEGEVLSSMLLVKFLEAVGVRQDASVRGTTAEWADAAMEERGLARGWEVGGQCSRGAQIIPRCWAALMAGLWLVHVGARR